MNLLKHTIMQGWPSTIKQVPPVLQSYWMFREELTIEDGNLQVMGSTLMHLCTSSFVMCSRQEMPAECLSMLISVTLR